MGRPPSVHTRIGEREARRAVRLRLHRGDVGMGPLSRGLGRGVRYCDRDDGGDGTVMRHFLPLALAPSALPGSVRTRPAVAALVSPSGAAQRLMPTDPRTLPRAVAVAAVAVAADAHLLGAAPAAVQPIRLLACLHTPAHAALDNAAHRWHKGKANALSRARACRRPGVLPGTCPGLRLSGVRDEHSAQPPLEPRGACA